MSLHPATRPEVKVGDWWLSTIAPYWGELVTKTRVNGDWEASFTVASDDNGTHWRHPALTYGAPVQVRLGPEIVFAGTLEEPDWDSGQMIASGVSRDGETALALDAAGKATTVPNTAIDQAIARGAVSWTRVDNFGATAVGDSDGSPVSLGSVLDAWARENGSGWYVNQDRQLRIGASDESNTAWLVVPGSGVLGSSAEERVDRIFVRYRTSTGLATASYPSITPAGGIEKPADITDRGPMDAAKALTIAQSMWEDLRGESGWTNGLTLTRGQITTLGGLDADLSTVRARQSMRLLGVPDPRGVAQNLDVVIGDTEYNWESDELQVNPIGMAARDDESLLEQVGNLAVDAMAKASVPVGVHSVIGTELVSFTTATSHVRTVNFPATLSAAPRIVNAVVSSGAGDTARWFVRTDTYTAASFRLILIRDTGAGRVAWSGVPVNWEAVL